MKTMLQRFILISILTTAMIASADVLELKNGTVLNGKFAGGNANSINFETSAGMQVINPAQAVALPFTAGAPPSGAAAAPAAPAGGTGGVTLPAGTTLLVRLLDPVSSQSPAGTKFSTRLEYDLVVGNAV